MTPEMMIERVTGTQQAPLSVSILVDVIKRQKSNAFFTTTPTTAVHAIGSNEVQFEATTIRLVVKPWFGCGRKMNGTKHWKRRSGWGCFSYCDSNMSGTNTKQTTTRTKWTKHVLKRNTNLTLVVNMA